MQDEAFSNLDEFEVEELIIANPWKRLSAALLDMLILIIPLGLMYGVAFSSIAFSTRVGAGNLENDTAFSSILFFMFFMFFMSFILPLIYFAYFESSAKQATPGKMAMKIYVTNLDGQRISFINAGGRYVAKTISGMILYIGYIMILFTKNNQGLHDMMASTLVLSKEN